MSIPGLRCTGFVPSRVKDSGRYVIRTSGIWIGLGLGAEVEGIRNDVGDVTQGTLPDLDEMGLPEDDDLN